MKVGRSLQDLAVELDRQAKSKADYVADTAVIAVQPQDRNVSLTLADKGEFAVGDIAHGQIAAHTGIPKPYYDKMKENAPELLANNIETWFRKYPAPRLVRTLDGRNRAFLSDAFRPLDNYDYAKVVLDVVAKRKLDVVSCEVTERRLYIKAIDTSEVQVPVGYKMGDGSHRIFDCCAPAFIASNSEVGFGRLTLETGIYTKGCTNLSWWADGGMRKTHLGSRHKLVEATGVDDFEHLLTNKTKAKSDEALWMQLRDVLGAAFRPELIAKRSEQLAATAENKITGKVEKVMNVCAERFELDDTEKDNVLRHLIQGGSLTQYGLHAAVTRAAQDAASYDRATELEYLGGKIVELPRAEWDRIAEAA